MYQNALSAGITGLCYDLDEDGYGSIDPLNSDLTFTMLGAIQMNILGIINLDNRTESLEDRVGKLERRLEYANK